MYKVTRQDAAERLDISTRSVDRYIKAGKLRSRKEWKIIYIHEQDIENISGKNAEKQPEVIINNRGGSFSSNSKQNSYDPLGSQQSTYDPLKEVNIANQNSSALALEKVYIDLRQEIKRKDQAISDLSIKLWQAQEIAKNSVSLIEFKKSQFLLEESKWHLAQEVTGLRQRTSDLDQKLKYEKSTNYILISFCVVLVIWLWLLWFLKI